MLFFPRRVRLICFFIVTPWEIGVILTANYTFLNYLVLVLGFLLLDDGYLIRLVPVRFRPLAPMQRSETPDRAIVIHPGHRRSRRGDRRSRPDREREFRSLNFWYLYFQP